MYVWAVFFFFFNTLQQWGLHFCMQLFRGAMARPGLGAPAGAGASCSGGEHSRQGAVVALEAVETGYRWCPSGRRDGCCSCEPPVGGQPPHHFKAGPGAGPTPHRAAGPGPEEPPRSSGLTVRWPGPGGSRCGGERGERAVRSATTVASGEPRPRRRR